MKDDPIRQDSPENMILTYQTVLTDIIFWINELKNDETYNLKRTLDLLWPHLVNIASPVSACAIIGFTDCIEGVENCPVIHHMINDSIKICEIENIDKESKNILISSLKAKETKCWNYNKNGPLFTECTGKNTPMALSWMCNKPDDEDLFLLLIRNKEKRPFFGDEIQAIELFSRVTGLQIYNTFVLQGLKGKMLDGVKTLLGEALEL